jgi:acyl-CoA thioester hydrolase
LRASKAIFADYRDEQNITVRVRYADTDRMGVVYHANYFVYFESGRAELIRRLWKPYAILEKEGFLLPILEAGCRYLQSAEYDDLLTVCTRVADFSGARIRFEYAAFKSEKESPLVEGFTVHCFVDRQGRPRRMPEELKNIFQAFDRG